MANIRLDLDSPVVHGQELTFKSPTNCADITGLIVYYQVDGEETSLALNFADAHGNNVGSADLFAENVLVKVILDTELNRAYVQNADTNAYLEHKFTAIEEELQNKAPAIAYGTADKVSGEKSEYPEGTLYLVIESLE